MVLVKNKAYGYLIAKKIKTYLFRLGLNEKNGEYLYKRLKEDYKDCSNEEFLNAIAKTKDMAVYGQYFYDTLDLTPFEFSKYVVNTHDANYCALFYDFDKTNKDLLFDEIVTSLNGRVCFDFLIKHLDKIDEEQKIRLKLSIIDSADTNVLMDCLKNKNLFTKDELELVEFAFLSTATPKNIKKLKESKLQEDEMCI